VRIHNSEGKKARGSGERKEREKEIRQEGKKERKE
jgi:hypothetical protein